MRNTKFNIDLETGHFLVSSNEFIFEKEDNHIIWELPIVKDKHFFESEWDFENNLLSFKMNGEDAMHLLEDIKNPLHKLADDTRRHHLSVMRYERT